MLITMKQSVNIRKCIESGMDVAEVAIGYGISEERVLGLCGKKPKKKRAKKTEDSAE